MTTKKKQDEKTLMGLCLVVAIALIVLGVLSVLKLQEKFNPANSSKNELPSMEGLEKAKKSKNLLEAKPAWSSSKISGRDLGLMTSIPVFKVPGEDELVDLYAETGSKVHPPIDNRWWLKYEIDPGYKDSPARDADGDGFSNLEEFQAKTDPSNAKSYPELIDKLKVVKTEAKPFRITFTSEVGEGKNQFKYVSQAYGSRGLRSKYRAAGDDIFSEGEAENRFTLIKVVEKEIVKGSSKRNVKHAVILDKSKGSEFEIAKQDKRGFLGKDYSITFSLKAAGVDSQSFLVKENEKFDLPSGKVSENGVYHFIKVNENTEVIIKYGNESGKKDKTISLN